MEGEIAEAATDRVTHHNTGAQPPEHILRQPYADVARGISAGRE
jgi:hypothetical protein